MKPEPSTDPRILYTRKEILQNGLKDQIRSQLSKAQIQLDEASNLENFKSKLTEVMNLIGFAELLHDELNSL